VLDLKRVCNTLYFGVFLTQTVTGELLEIMPAAFKRICTYPGCNALVDAPQRTGARCPKHERPAWHKREDAPERVRGRALQDRRKWYFSQYPLCAECERKGKTHPAKELDHIIPLEEDGVDEPGNWQGLCLDCHREKTQREAQRGRLR